MASSTPLQRPRLPKSRTCKFCFKSFSKAEHLSRHERSHTKERPFRCKKCQKCYSRNDTLIRHGKVHNKGKGILKTPAERKTPSGSAKLDAGTIALDALPTLFESAAEEIEYSTSPVEGLKDFPAIDPNLQDDQQNQPTGFTMNDFSNQSLGQMMHDTPQNLQNVSFSFSPQAELCVIEAESNYPPWHIEDDFDLGAFESPLLAPAFAEDSMWDLTSAEGQETLAVMTKVGPSSPAVWTESVQESCVAENDRTSRKIVKHSLTTAPAVPKSITSANGVGIQDRGSVAQKTCLQWKEALLPPTGVIEVDLGATDGCFSTIS